MHNITLDFSNPGLPQVIDVMQSDAQSRFIGLTLYDGGVPYSAPSGAQYTVQYRGSGANNMGWYDTIQLSSGTRKAVVVSSSSPNVVTLELAEQALRVNGKVEVSLCVVNNTGYKLNTFPIICRVTGAPYVDPVAVRSYFYVTGITSDQWLAYVTACQDAQKRAEDAAANMVIDRYPKFISCLAPEKSFNFDEIHKDNRTTAIFSLTQLSGNIPFSEIKNGATWYVGNNYDSQSGLEYIEQYVYAPGNPSMKQAIRVYDGATWHQWNIYDININSSQKFISCLAPEKSFNFDEIHKDNRTTAIFSLTQLSGNIPFSEIKNGATWYVGNNYDSQSGLEYIEQYVYAPGNPSMKQAIRLYDGTAWQAWNVNDPQTGNTNSIIHCGIGQPYTTLRSACEYAITSPNTTVIVHPGTYDLTAEFSDHISSQSGSGIELTNNIHIIFLAGSYVTAIFGNSSRWIYDNFEPFRATGDFTLEGLNITAENCRYCVHDEHAGAGTYHNKYIDCVMQYTNTHSDINYVQCIGGGLGEHGYIDIVGGMYTSIPTIPYSGETLEESTQPISYHNGNNANADSKIVISNVYLTGKGRFRFGDYGPSTKKTKVLITGCRMGGKTIHRYENSEFSVTNFEVIEWNNAIE